MLHLVAEIATHRVEQVRTVNVGCANELADVIRNALDYAGAARAAAALVN